jgi:DNA-binding beta-propeller fold protein YncE
MMRAGLIAVVLAVGATAALARDVAPIPGHFFRLQSAVKLAGKAPDWDYLAYDAKRHRLFIARRDDGLWVYDTTRGRLILKMPRSAGAGAALLVPEIGRGFSSNEDGTTTVFSLATLKPLARVKFAEDADAASYDPVTGQVAFVSADSQKITFMDGKTLKVGASVPLTTKKADGSVADGEGHILLAERDRNMLARIDVGGAKVTDEWPITGCAQPTGIAYDRTHHRAFVGCRSAKPVLAVVNTDTGTTLTALELGRGNDGVVYDAKRQNIITTNGIDANIIVFHQDDADHYHMTQTITTRPNARTMAFDAAAQQIFTVTAEGVVDPARKVNTGPSPFYPNGYFDDSFVVLTYTKSHSMKLMP